MTFTGVGEFAYLCMNALRKTLRKEGCFGGGVQGETPWRTPEITRKFTFTVGRLALFARTLTLLFWE